MSAFVLYIAILHTYIYSYIKNSYHTSYLKSLYTIKSTLPSIIVIMKHAAHQKVKMELIKDPTVFEFFFKNHR